MKADTIPLPELREWVGGVSIRELAPDRWLMHQKLLPLALMPSVPACLLPADTVVDTYSLCVMTDPTATLMEMARVVRQVSVSVFLLGVKKRISQPPKQLYQPSRCW